MAITSSPQRTLFREALQAALSEALGVEFQGGIIEGPQTDRDIGCVWWDNKRPHRAAVMEENQFGVRLLKLFKQDQGGAVPREDVATGLEQAAEDLEAALRAILTLPWLQAAVGAPVGDQAFFSVIALDTSYPGQYVQATLRAIAMNRSDYGG